MNLPSEHRLGKAWSMGVHSRDNLIGSCVALTVPASPLTKIVAEVLAEQARNMLALGSKGCVERRGNEHFDNGLVGPAVHSSIEVGAVHIIEARCHDNAGSQMIALFGEHGEFGEFG